MSYNKCFISKTITVLLMVVVLFTTFSVTTFAQETQPVHTEENEVKYVSSDDVHKVFSKYESYFKSIPDGETVTKSDLLENIKESNVPTRIILDLEINTEDLISEDDLVMYLEEIEEKENERNCNIRDWILIILVFLLVIFIFFIALDISGISGKLSNLNGIFEDLKNSLDKDIEKVPTNQEQESNKKEKRKKYR